MTQAYLEATVESLKLYGVQFADGLTDKEVDTAERKYGICFPPDLRAFLQCALPVSEKWVDWRNGSEKSTREGLDWPADGICFDVEQNNFWMANWGPRPVKSSHACSLARQHVAEAPRLIPIYSHRYISSEPCEAGSPVFSVYQTDIIYYGADLASYFINEFHSYGSGFNQEVRERHLIFETAAMPQKPIRFWDKLVG